MRRLIALCLCLSLFSVMPVSGQEIVPTCTPNSDVSPRLIVGEQGRVLSGVQLNLRETAGTDVARIGVLPAGSTFTVLAESQCAEGYTWWQIEYTDRETEETLVGWLAEGDPETEDYWVEARGAVVYMLDSNGIERAFVMDADGNLEREGCLRPPDDYNRVQLGYATLNIRTLAMLDQAQRIYDYERGGDLVNFRQLITQGSYNAGGVSASFGTHDGGGAVDISVRSYIDWSVLTDEIEPMIDALRVAGFAAWLRDTGELYADSPIHIHAIAVGDAEQSEIARQQVESEFGYLYGNNGLPFDDPSHGADRYGDPIICSWMREMGLDDFRELPEAESTPEPTNND